MVSPGWADVGRYLRPSILAFGKAYPPDALRQMLTEYVRENDLLSTATVDAKVGAATGPAGGAR